MPATPASAFAAHPAVAERDVSVVLHVSDTHFGAEDPAAVAALIQLADAERPDAVVASGDITQRAQRHEFDAGRRFFDRLAAPHTLVVPGSHDLPRWDLPRRLLAPFAGFRRVFGDDLEPRLVAPFVWIAGLVSPRRWRPRRGTLSAAQVQRTAQWLASAPPGTLRVVVAHHPLAAPPLKDQSQVVSGSEGTARRLAEAGVHVVLGGHTHTPFTLPLQPEGRTSLQPLWVTHAGSAVSRRLRAGAMHSVNLLRRGVSGGWRIEQWTLQPGTARFRCAHWHEVGV